MKNMGIGLLLTVFGMGTTFIALWVVILSSKFLGFLFPFKQEEEEEEQEIQGTGEEIIEWTALETEAKTSSEMEDSETREVEVILTAAVTSYLQAEEDEEPYFKSRIVSMADLASSPWKMEGRRELFASRKMPGRWKKR